ncbi:MAG: hypothetical protein V5A37_07280 [Halobacteriales archaeon]|jgi:hypothetical protein
MTEDYPQPFSRFYADLLRQAGEEVGETDRRLDVPLPKLANPRRGSDET